MTRMLETYLRIAFNPESNESKRIVEKEIPRSLTTWHGDEIKTVRELLLSESIETTTLIQTEMNATALEGAEPFKVMRQAVPVLRMAAQTLRYPLQETGTVADTVAEGAEIPISVQDYDYRDFTAVKYGARPLISNELIEDALFDVVAMEVQKAGAKVENALNADMMYKLLENAGNECDTTGGLGSAQGVDAAASAIALNKDDYLGADVIIMCPGYERRLLNDFVPSNYFGGENAMRTGAIPTVLGMRALVYSGTPTSGTYTWRYTTDGDIGAIVIDSKNAGAIGMRRDISLARYNDPIRDLVGCSVTMRAATNYLLANAIARIEF